jgi:aminomethyltransferase
MPAALRTSLHAWHAANRGRLVEFGGWSMPVMYASIVDEHNAVRNRVGLFDIGHMGRLQFRGPGALDWLEYATTNHVARLRPGQIQYSLMVRDSGGVIDDILVYRSHRDDEYAVVCNASNREKVVEELRRLQGGRDAELTDRTFSTGMIAVQGPRALELAGRVVTGPLASLAYYHHADAEALGQDVAVSRTGYTGEDGFEIVVPAEAAEALWIELLDAGVDLGVAPCGLGARDTLRLEAAMPLYGHEMDETVDPYSAGLGWAVKPNKGEFQGRDALKRLKATASKRRVGLILEGKRIARQGSVVLLGGQSAGVVTSGTFSPTLGASLAMASVEGMAGADSAEVDVRGPKEAARIVALPFYRRPAAEPVTS